MSAPAVVVRKLALIGGSSFLESAALAGLHKFVVDTPHGGVIVRSNKEGSLLFVQRHAANPDEGKEYSPPHLINYKAIAKALKQLVRGSAQRSSASRAENGTVTTASLSSRLRHVVVAVVHRRFFGCLYVCTCCLCVVL
jgi:hypothetical protein